MVPQRPTRQGHRCSGRQQLDGRRYQGQLEADLSGKLKPARPGLEIEDLFDDLFTPIARDGASIVEVCIRLQKALRDLAGLNPEGRYAANSKKHSRLALERAEHDLKIEDDRQRVRAVAAEVARV